jgi:hypothetical protein
VKERVNGVTITAKKMILQVMLFVGIISFMGASLIKKNAICFMYTTETAFLKYLF